MTPRREHPLSRAELLDAALRIVDTEGLPALTMRRLADAVGVEAMSLYHHVPSKEVLLDRTIERMRSELRLPDPVPEDWVDIMAAIFGGYRRVLAAHPNMLPLAARRTDSAPPIGLQFLIDQGFAPDDAVELYQSLTAFTVGYSMLSSPFVGADRSPVPGDLAERARDWRDGTCERTLRMIMAAYGSRRHAVIGAADSAS
ncbi:MAG: TetR family transcriptional regulator [Candidatus Limnocylindrales bacterium]|jgi:AcrR family transcriptional regulator